MFSPGFNINIFSSKLAIDFMVLADCVSQPELNAERANAHSGRASFGDTSPGMEAFHSVKFHYLPRSGKAAHT